MTVLKQAQKLNTLLDKALSLSADGDRVAYAVKGFTTFRAGEYTTSEAVLNIPKDADFFGYSLNVYLQGRVVSISNPTNSERTFRPATLTWENVASGGGALVSFFGNADFRVEIRDSYQGVYQNAPIFSSSFFSAMADRNYFTPQRPFISAWQGSLQFSTPYYLPRGETMTLRLTPIDSRPDNTQVDGDRREYRLVCVLQGYKSVHAFK